MRELIKLVSPDSMKSSHPERSNRDDIKQKTTRRKELECPTRGSREAVCIRVFRDNAKQMQTSQRCNKERSHPTGEAWYDNRERSLEIKQVSREMYGKRGEKMKSKRSLMLMKRRPMPWMLCDDSMW